MRPRRIWKHINTDAMSWEVLQRTAERTLNTVLLQDQAVNPIEYSEEVVKGFQTAYSFLLTHRDELLTPDGPLAAFCCGNGGRIELLVAASQRLQQPHLLEVARQWSSVVIRRSEQCGGFRLLAKLPRQAYNPGLFQGTAGIGYQLLRVAFPDQVPSVLLWE
jgi:lantibiotic modifying enzyme